jgi:hypothetical protein
VECQAVDGRALLGHLDRVEAALAHVHRHRARLVDRCASPHGVRLLEHEPEGTGQAAGLLVGGRGEQDIPREPRHRVARGIPAGLTRLGREEADDLELHRDLVLHVQRATAVQPAVRDVAREGVVGPAVERRRDDVEVR